MRRSLLAGWIPLVVCAFPFAANASATAAIELSALQVSVSTLSPDHVPAVAFMAVSGSSAESDANDGDPATDHGVRLSSGLAFGQVVAAVSSGGSAGGYAALVGNAFGEGAVVRTSAFADSGGPESTGQGTVGLADGVSAAAFTLAPWTRVTISATVTAIAAVDGACPSDYADSGFSMTVSDHDGQGLQFQRVTFDAFAWGLFGAIDDVESTFVSLSYENDSDVALTGLFSGYVGAIAYAAPAAVPEPSQAALVCTGLLALVATRRRRGDMKKAGGSRP